jgi:serine protease Do
MISATLFSIARAARPLTFSIVLLLSSTPAPAQETSATVNARGADDTLVRVNITTETRGRGERVVINGREISDYRPRIIQIFPATGIVIDDSGHVLTFLGYRWVDIQGSNRRIEVVTNQGRKLPGRLVGIDQSVGVAIVKPQGAKLKKTPFCRRCEVRDGLTVVTRVLGSEGSEFQRAQISSVGSSSQGQDLQWEVTIDRHIPGIGEPLLDTDHRVLGFIASQKPSGQDLMGIHTIVYPMSQLLTSAEKILQAGTDIRTGWLGVFLDDASSKDGMGVAIRNVLQDSPAHRAGLADGDVLLKWNQIPLQHVRQFIRMVQETPAGTRVDLDIMRQGERQTLSATIDSRKPEDTLGKFVVRVPELIPPADVPGQVESNASQGQGSRQAGLQVGLEVVPLNPQLADYMKIPGQSGLLVSRVEPNTAAETSGLQAGDVILSIDGRRILDPQTLSSYIQSRASGDTLLLRFLRKGVERSAVIPLRQPRTKAPMQRPKF